MGWVWWLYRATSPTSNLGILLMFICRPLKLNMEPDTWGPQRSHPPRTTRSGSTGFQVKLGGWFPYVSGSPTWEASNFLQRRLLLELSWQSVFLHPTLSATGFNWKEYNAFELADTANSRREMSAAAKAQAFWGILPGVFSVSERDLCFLSFQMANSGPMVPTGPHRSCVVVIGSNSQDPPSPFLMEPDWDKFCHRPCPASDYSNCSLAQQARRRRLENP